MFTLFIKFPITLMPLSLSVDGLDFIYSIKNDAITPYLLLLPPSTLALILLQHLFPKHPLSLLYFQCLPLLFPFSLLNLLHLLQPKTIKTPFLGFINSQATSIFLLVSSLNLIWADLQSPLHWNCLNSPVTKLPNLNSNLPYFSMKWQYSILIYISPPKVTILSAFYFLSFSFL